MGNACGKADLNNAQIYCQQPKIHYDQLNTENDLKGKIVIESILRPSRDVLGQPPVDMAANPVDWSEYGLDFKNIKRPIPEDFPAFEIRGGGPRASVEGTPISSAEKKSRNSKVESASKNAPKESSKQSPAPAPATPSKSTQTLVKQNSKTSKSGDQSKNTNSKDKEKDKTAAAAANKKRVSRNVDMDDCSLEGD